MEEPTRILLQDPDLSEAELDAVQAALLCPNLGPGPLVERFEAAMAAYLGRKHAIACTSAPLGLAMALRAAGIGPGDEVIAAPFSFRELPHGIGLASASCVLAEVDYWSACLSPVKAAEHVRSATRAILVGNTNGHPAAWAAFRTLAEQHQLLLIEDASDALGSRYQGQAVGSFGQVSILDLGQFGPITCGSGAIVLTDDATLATAIRRICHRRPEERGTAAASWFPLQIGMGDPAAALGLVQLERLPAILERRTRVERDYLHHLRSFEGLKPPYRAPDVDEIHWGLYVVHLGTRFSRSARDAILQDLHTAGIDALPYCHPLHLQPAYRALGYQRGDFLVTEKLADRAIALPFHGHLTEDQVGFIVQTLKDASINVGAGTAIYL